MTETDRLYRWNRWYDQQPEVWRSQIIVWFLVALAAFNTALSIWTGFPFLLLVVLAIAAIALVRVPYRMGWLQAPAGPRTSRRRCRSRPGTGCTRPIAGTTRSPRASVRWW